MARSRALVLLLVLAVVGAAGCGGSQPSASAAASQAAVATASASPSPSPTPSPTVAPTPTPSPSPSPTVAPASIRLPAGWKEVPLDEATMSEGLAQLSAANPQFGQWLQMAIDAGMLKMITNIALRYHGTRMSGDVAILRLGSLGGADLDLVTSTLESQFKMMGAKRVKTKKVTLPAGDAVQFDFVYQFKTGSGSLSVTDRAWIVLADGVAYEVATTCLNDVANCLADGSSIANSFHPAPGS